MESAILNHQFLGGFVWEGPKEIEYDIAGFTGLNSESVDWGITTGDNVYYWENILPQGTMRV